MWVFRESGYQLTPSPVIAEFKNQLAANEREEHELRGNLSGGGVAEATATEDGPALDASPVAGLPVGVFGFQDEPGIDYKM